MKGTFPRGDRLYPAHYAILYFTKGQPQVFNHVRLPIPACRHCGKDIKDYFDLLLALKGSNGALSRATARQLERLGEIAVGQSAVAAGALALKDFIAGEPTLRPTENRSSPQ